MKVTDTLGSVMNTADVIAYSINRGLCDVLVLTDKQIRRINKRLKPMGERVVHRNHQWWVEAI